MDRFDRKATLINKRFHHFLLPTILSTIAISLNEFVDSIIVSHLLGQDAMSMVNMGFPIMLLFAVVYTLFGVGGSIVYAESAGKQEIEKAERCFSMTFVSSIVLSAIILAVGLVFTEPIALSMCHRADMLDDFLPYLQALFISSVLIIPMQVLITFLPAFGKPGAGSALNIIANAVNLVMDYILIHFFQTGLKGAAFATMIGYAAGVILVAALLISGKIKMPIKRFSFHELKNLPRILSRGAAPALNQFGYCVKISFCNYLAMRMEGIGGVAVFALCMQVVSIVSVIIVGIVASMTPIAAALKGQGDRKGISMLMRSVMKIQFISNLVLVIILELFPQIILAMYNIGEVIADASIIGIRIFSIMFVFRGFVFVFMYYFQIISRKIYAVILSIIDGFAGVIPLTLILTSFMGINGLWAAFPVLSCLMFIGIIITNMTIARRSHGQYQGLYLIKSEKENAAVFDGTIPMDMPDIMDFARGLRTHCLENGLSTYTSKIVAMASEEMLVYTAEHVEMTGINETDILVKIYPDTIVMDLRSIGKPFDIASAQDERFSSINVLKSIASSIDFGYVLGMNQTRITISK